ncbi:MAG: hypothetical protein AAF624_12650 [Bacteroidota bacterium]
MEAWVNTSLAGTVGVLPRHVRRVPVLCAGCDVALHGEVFEQTLGVVAGEQAGVLRTMKTDVPLDLPDVGVLGGPAEVAGAADEADFVKEFRLLRRHGGAYYRE